MKLEKALLVLAEKQIKLVEENKKLRDALVWCGGSEDFAVGGKAREGWESMVIPLLNNPEWES